MTEQEQDTIRGRLMRKYKEANDKVICIEAKLDEMGDYLFEISKIAKRDPRASGYDMDGKDGTLRIGFQSVAHSDQDVHEWLEKRKDWIKKRGQIESQLKKLGIL